jgi:hypothetical protein
MVPRSHPNKKTPKALIFRAFGVPKRIQGKGYDYYVSCNWLKRERVVGTPNFYGGLDASQRKQRDKRVDT